MISGTVLKFLLAEFNKSQPETYAHHKAVRDLIPDEKLRDFGLVDIDDATCEFLLDTPSSEIETKEASPQKEKPEPLPQKHPKSHSDSEDSLLGSDDDYEEEDDIFRKKRETKHQPLTCKQVNITAYLQAGKHYRLPANR